MGFWGSFLSAFKNIAITLAIDTVAMLMGGGGSKKPDELKDKAFRSQAYGSPWPRCRGVVRCQGKDLWGTPIQTSFWKTVSGGLFGIGQTSVTYPKYSASRFIGFGKKLNGGAAISFLRLWADGKLLFNRQASTGSITGTVTVSTVVGGQLQGSQLLKIDLASGASVTINAGDLIVVPTDPQPYTAQTTVTATGPTTISVPIWPPLRLTLTGGGQVSIPPVSSNPYDLTSFDPNPHDGSHLSGGFNCPPGGIRFYLGSDTQNQDPLMVAQLGAANVPAYRGLVGVMIHDLQLANYGDHFPAITAEIAYDVASPLYPSLSVPQNVYAGNIDFGPGAIYLLPNPQASSLSILNPITQTSRYMWVNTDVGVTSPWDTDFLVIDTTTNTVIGRIGQVSREAVPAVAVDTDNRVYVLAQNCAAAPAPSGGFYGKSYGLGGLVQGWVLFQFDGFSGALLNYYGTLQLAATPLDPVTGPPWAPGHGYVKNSAGNIAQEQYDFGFTGSIFAWDIVASLFGNLVTIKLLAISSGGTAIFDRKSLVPFGNGDPSGINCWTICVGYDQHGNPWNQIGSLGSAPVTGKNFGNGQACADAHGNLWIADGGSVVERISVDFASAVDISTLTPYVKWGFSTTDVDLSSYGSNFQIRYDSASDSIVFVHSGGAGRIDCKTLAITHASIPGLSTPVAPAIDITGTLLCNLGSHPVRLDVASLTVVSTYNLALGTPTGTTVLDNWTTFDWLTDSVWISVKDNSTGLAVPYRIFLDRANGSGIGLDSIVSTLMLEAGFSSGQFDVTQLTAAGITCYGVEFDRETFLESLRKLMQFYLFDAAEIDGKIVFVPRGQASVVTIPEDDLGALDDPTKYEPRAQEILTDERDVPAKVTAKYYDPLKDSLQATQEFKRTLQAYPSGLSAAKVDTASRQEVDIATPITEHALQVKQQAYKILWDAVAGRFQYKFKLPPKYVRLDPTDVITLAYKNQSLVMRIIEADFGASFAREITAVSQDASVYDASAITLSSAGLGSGTGTGSTPSPSPTPVPLSYTVSPTYALSEASATEVDMVQVTVLWSDGRTTIYAARAGASGFVVADPGAGNSQLYYVTIYDPNRTGEVAGTPSLTAYCDVTPQAVFLGQTGYIFIGTITITHDGIGVIVTSGGSQNISQAQGFYVNGSGGSAQSSQIDVLTYLINSQRATKHLTGSAGNSGAANIYSYHDPATHSIAQIKSASGWAADIQLYGSDYVYQYITELDDPGYRLWSDPSSFKKYVLSGGGYQLTGPLPIMPRYITPGATIPDIVIPSPTNFNRYTACGLIDTINRGAQICRNYLVASMNFDNDGFGGGNLGNIPTLVHERYAGSSRERMYWGLNLGFVKWDAATLISGSQISGVYKITNWAVHNKLVSGGGVSPGFSCGYGVGWP